jgi:hypothetical protein
MVSSTRRDFIRRSMRGAAGLGLLGAGKCAAGAESGRPGLPPPARGPQTVAAHPTEIVVTATPVRERFGGVGFHAEMFLDVSTQDFFEQVLAKRWRELNPRFARLFHHWQQGQPGVRDAKTLEAMARQLVFMKEAAGTEIYITTADLKEATSDEDRRAYAGAVVDDLEYLVNRGATNLKYYCCTNELSLHEWADMHDDLPKYQSYQQSIFNEIKRRGLNIKLLATDASPVEYWPSLAWAAAHMDDITGIYGGHHYINEHEPDNLDFYSWFKERCGWAVNLARAKGKDFILGEFGPAQYFDLKYGVRWDACRYFDTPLEPWAGLQLAEAALAAINAGVYALSYWTFTDYPDEKGATSINQWGVFKWLTNGAAPRAPYYSYGLLTKFFRGPATVHQVNTPEAKLRVAAIRHDEDKTWSIAVINRATREAPVKLMLPGASQPAVFRKYVYDPKHVPVTVDGDLQEPAAKIPLRDGVLADVVEAGCLAVYTTAYDDTPPAAVRGLEATRLRDTRIPGGAVEATRLRWTPNTEPDLCYYRVYHHGVRIGSTAASEFIDSGPGHDRPGGYSVVAVDRSGNASSS